MIQSGILGTMFLHANEDEDEGEACDLLTMVVPVFP